MVRLPVSGLVRGIFWGNSARGSLVVRGLNLILRTIATGHLGSAWRGRGRHHALECGRSWGGWRRVLIPGEVLGYDMLHDREDHKTWLVRSDEVLTCKVNLESSNHAFLLQMLHHVLPKYGLPRSWPVESLGPGSSCQPGRWGAAGDWTVVAPLTAGNDSCHKPACQLVKVVQEERVVVLESQGQVRRDKWTLYQQQLIYIYQQVTGITSSGVWWPD